MFASEQKHWGNRYLVDGVNPSLKILVKWMITPGRVEIKKVNHHLPLDPKTMKNEGFDP